MYWIILAFLYMIFSKKKIILRCGGVLDQQTLATSL